MNFNFGIIRSFMKRTVAGLLGFVVKAAAWVVKKAKAMLDATIQTVGEIKTFLNSPSASPVARLLAPSLLTAAKVTACFLLSTAITMLNVSLDIRLPNPIEMITSVVNAIDYMKGKAINGVTTFIVQGVQRLYHATMPSV